jgi:hypothetical protein
MLAKPIDPAAVQPDGVVTDPCVAWNVMSIRSRSPAFTVAGIETLCVVEAELTDVGVMLCTCGVGNSTFV